MDGSFFRRGCVATSRWRHPRSRWCDSGKRRGDGYQICFTADGCVRCAAALCEDGAEAWTCMRHNGQSAAALAIAAGHAATDARVRAKLAALAGAMSMGCRQRHAPEVGGVCLPKRPVRGWLGLLGLCNLHFLYRT